MRKQRKNSRQLTRRGFTLLEVLVATAIMSVLLASLYSVFRGAIKLREHTFNNLETGLPKSYILELMKRDISHAAAPAGLLAGPLFGGTEEERGMRRDRVEFFTTTGVLHEQEPWGDIQKVSYYLLEPESSENNGGYDFVRAVTRNLLTTVAEEPEEQRLLKNVQSLEITYFDGEYWQDSWDSTTMDNQNPVAMRVRITFSPAEGESPELPVMELIAEIAAQAPSGTGNGNG